MIREHLFSRILVNLFLNLTTDMNTHSGRYED